MIFTLKDKYILGYITAIWVYLCFRANHTSQFYAEYDYILLTIVTFGAWYVMCSYRTFVMTRSELTKHYMESDLDYVPFIKDGMVENIYVKLHQSENWYELDYILTIPQGCNMEAYNVFVRENNKVSSLLKTMNHNERKGDVRLAYKTMKMDYKTIKWLTFSIIVICYIIVPLMLTKI